MMSGLQTPADILDDAVLYLRVYFVGFPFLFMYNIDVYKRQTYYSVFAQYNRDDK